MFLIHLLLPLVLSSVAAASDHHRITKTGNPLAVCAAIQSSLPGRISYANGSVYNASQTSFYTTEERDLTPSCVFRPESAADVSTFVKLVNLPSSGGTQFAIRSGGHMLFSAAANIDNGITIDMRGLDTVVVSEDRKSAAVGGGTIWSNVYPQLVPHNLTGLGARVPGIAIGGFTSGGGINFLGRKYGWSCDNVFGYEVVLASGEIVYASESSHKDLWLALKGGSNNFGIITQFNIATYPLHVMWGGVMVYNYTPAVLQAQAEAFTAFMEPEIFDPLADMSIILTYQNPGNVFGIIDSLFYSADEAYPKTLSNFTSIPSTANTLATQTVAELVNAFGEILPTSLERCFQLVYSFTNVNASVYSQLISLWETGVAPMADVAGLDIQFLLQPQPVTNGTNSLGLPAGETDIVLAALTAGWDNSDDTTLVQNSIRAIYDQHVDLLRQEGVYTTWQYLNYADISQNPIGGYGAANAAALRAASKRYDPHGLFQTGVPGGFKLFQ